MNKRLNRFFFYTLIGLFTIVLYSCQTAEQVTREGEGEQGPVAETDLMEETGFDLRAYRNTLSDVYATQQHDMPEVFLQRYEGGQVVERDPFDGFRIQIISTRSIEEADSTARHFRGWADSTLAGYIPQTYTVFRQPYYKVHVGDFHNQERAYSVSRLIKSTYPDAWVVHDRIDPGQVPADTLQTVLAPEEPDTLQLAPAP